MSDSPNTGLQLAGMSDDVRADLLRAQMEGTTTSPKLPKIKVMPAGAGLYEFTDADGKTVPSFIGIVLNHHPRNILWDKGFDEQPTGEGQNLPACQASDGKWGTPREGFHHAGLGGEAGDGFVKVECRTCPYNQWGSGNMLNPKGNPKGKAVTNQRSVYVLVDGHETPYELVLPPSSIAGFDDYVSGLSNRGVPLLAVYTEFRQVKKQGKNNPALKWGVAAFATAGNLSNDQFLQAMEKRNRYMDSIVPAPTAPLPPAPAKATVAEPEDADVVEGDNDSDLPF